MVGRSVLRGAVNSPTGAANSIIYAASPSRGISGETESDEIRKLFEAFRRKSPDYTTIRLDYAPKILLALDIFIANDLVRTTLASALDQEIILAFIVGIMTVVGVSLNSLLRELSK